MQLGDLSAVRLLIVGDVMLDRYWFGDVSRISPEAPVPVVKVERSEERPGGAANVARNAAALGAKVSLLALVGNDEPGVSLKRLMQEGGIDASLHVDEAVTTTVKPANGRGPCSRSSAILTPAAAQRARRGAGTFPADHASASSPDRVLESSTTPDAASKRVSAPKELAAAAAAAAASSSAAKPNSRSSGSKPPNVITL